MDGSGAEEEELDGPVTKVGMRRQVIGILVSVVCPFLPRLLLTPRCVQMLEMGIMIHSFVIGLTLAITSGPEFSE